MQQFLKNSRSTKHCSHVNRHLITNGLLSSLLSLKSTLGLRGRDRGGRRSESFLLLPSSPAPCPLPPAPCPLPPCPLPPAPCPPHLQVSVVLSAVPLRYTLFIVQDNHPDNHVHVYYICFIFILLVLDD